MKSLSSEQSKYLIFDDRYLKAITQGSHWTSFNRERVCTGHVVLWQGVLVAHSTCFQSQEKLVQICNNNWMPRMRKKYLLLLPSEDIFFLRCILMLSGCILKEKYTAFEKKLYLMNFSSVAILISLSEIDGQEVL